MQHRADLSVADPRPPEATTRDISRDAPRGARAPLRLQVLSDLHFDVGPCPMPRPVPGVDAVVVAGDTCEGVEKSFAYLRAAFPAPLPLIVVLGNREFQGRALVDETRRARIIAPEYGITLLDHRTVEHDGIRFVGSTLWTDYRLDGEDRQLDAMSAAVERRNQGRIALTSVPWRPFTPVDSMHRHEAASAYLTRVLAAPFDGPTVVVSHHAPSARSLHPGRVRDSGDAHYANHLDRMIVRLGPALWIHGHVHRSCDYGLCRTRVVCNAKGAHSENPTFDPSFVVEVPR